MDVGPYGRALKTDELFFGVAWSSTQHTQHTPWRTCAYYITPRILPAAVKKTESIGRPSGLFIAWRQRDETEKERAARTLQKSATATGDFEC